MVIKIKIVYKDLTLSGDKRLKPFVLYSPLRPKDVALKVAGESHWAIVDRKSESR